jgi:hypothetical protein
MARSCEREWSPNAGWSPNMEQRSGLDGRQVKCLIASEGYVWMRDFFDQLPPRVRSRLANSAHNICPACMDEKAHALAVQRKERKPSIATYFAMIEMIERQQ